MKPGIKKLALKRGKELNRIKKEQLNLLRLRQSFLNRKLSIGETWRLRELKVINSILMLGTKKRVKTKFQSQVIKCQQNEKVGLSNIYSYTRCSNATNIFTITMNFP